MMDSQHASALSGEELMSVAYDEGTLSHEQLEHLSQCAICQGQLALYTTTNARLQSKLYRSICPSGVNLSYYCLGVVPEEERVRIASHVLDCPACADEVAEIRRVQATVDLYPAAWSPPISLRRLFATLVVQQAQPVTRAILPNVGWPRQYRAESIDLSLHLSRSGDGALLLLGIITSTDPDEPVNAFEGQVVDLYQAPGPLAAEDEDGEASTPVLSTSIDDVGNIVLEGIQPGSYVMILRLSSLEVMIEGLDVELR